MLGCQIGNDVDEMAGVKRFGHVDLKAGGKNRIAIDGCGVGRKGDGRYETSALTIASTDPSDQGITVVIGHSDIGNENVGS